MPAKLTTARNFAALAAAGLGLLSLLAAVAFSMRAEPASANPSSGFAAVSGGEGHTCALTTSGGVKCWGWNQYGALGVGTDGYGSQSTVPVSVCAVANCSGMLTNVASISAQYEHNCVVTTAGAAKCWGRNDYGEIGNGTSGNIRTIPTDVTGLGSGVTSISVGISHTCAVVNDQAMCWGANEKGELGDGTTNSSTVPVAVQGIGEDVVSVAAGLGHSCALTVSGGVKCWGWNVFGALGDNQACGTDACSIVDVVGLGSGVAAIAAGFFSNCALMDTGGLKCWGDNGSGQLGDGTTTERHSPVDVSGLASGVNAVSLTKEHTCALTDTGAAKCWGRGVYGEIGDGTLTAQHTPTDVSGLGSGVTAITAGFYHSCAVLSTTGAQCWGINNFGQIGDGTTSQRATPVDVLDVLKETPTPTPTSTPVPCPSPPCLLDFSLGVDYAGATGDECDTTEGSTTCAIPAGALFHANVYLNDLGDVTKYQATSAFVTYAGVSAVGKADSVWPGCVLEAPLTNETSVITACAVGVGAPPVTFIGRIATSDFTCDADGAITLVHGEAETLLIDDEEETRREFGPNETLTIDCVAPQAHPGDTDGDGCPDANEMLANPAAGGQRNFLNPNDYFNPTHDGLNRIDDIVAGLSQYFDDDDDANPGLAPYEPGYSPDTDRKYVGPNAWNLGPPNGLQRIDDIVNVLNHYFHDCA